jgi:N-acetylmuramoyl-L-alanine amidase
MLVVLALLLAAPPFRLSAQSPRLFSLEETLGALGTGAEFRWDPLFRTGVLSAAGHTAAFGTGLPGETGVVLRDGRELLDLPLPYTEAGILRFPEAFVSALWPGPGRGGRLPGPPVEKGGDFRIAAVIIDPGHGGKDTGAIGSQVIDGKTVRLVEKDIVLQVSRDLHSRLSALYPDKRVMMTRTGDTFPSLEDRVVFAHSVPLKEHEAIIFISIHANSSFNAKARGYEVWYLSPEYRRTVIEADKSGDPAEVVAIRNAMMEEEFTTESIIMAQSILKGFDEHLGRLMPSRGIKEEEWFVVRKARMPAVLVELGFVSNLDDARLLSSEAHLRKFSDALYKGIIDFVTLFERSGGFTVN